jgi:hypothetical protein
MPHPFFIAPHSPQESESKKAVDRIVEEFRRFATPLSLSVSLSLSISLSASFLRRLIARRYKIRSEIARKQKDKEGDRVAPRNLTNPITPSLDKIMSNAAAGYIDLSLNRGGTFDEDSSPSLQKLQVTLLRDDLTSPALSFSESNYQLRAGDREMEGGL